MLDHHSDGEAPSGSLICQVAEEDTTLQDSVSKGDNGAGTKFYPLVSLKNAKKMDRR